MPTDYVRRSKKDTQLVKTKNKLPITAINIIMEVTIFKFDTPFVDMYENIEKMSKIRNYVCEYLKSDEEVLKYSSLTERQQKLILHGGVI